MRSSEDVMDGERGKVQVDGHHVSLEFSHGHEQKLDRELVKPRKQGRLFKF